MDIKTFDDDQNKDNCLYIEEEIEKEKDDDDDLKEEKDFCPNPKCEWHEVDNIPKGVKWYLRHGYYLSVQHGKIARFMCLKCHKTFSARTNHESFYLHFDEYDIREIGMEYYSGVTQKEIAQKYGITIQMVRTRIKRFNPYKEGLFLDWGVAESATKIRPEESEEDK